MEITDVLVGNQSVLIKRADGENIELDRNEDGFITTPKSQLSNQVIDALQSRSIPISNEFPKSKTLYAHDEQAYTVRELSDTFDVDESLPVLDDVVGLTYEMPFTVVLEDKNTWKITHAFGKRLEEPYYY